MIGRCALAGGGGSGDSTVTALSFSCSMLRILGLRQAREAHARSSAVFSGSVAGAAQSGALNWSTASRRGPIRLGLAGLAVSLPWDLPDPGLTPPLGML